jgi:mono/diheme cytochrome c family protein
MRKILMAVALISAGACGDNDTNDHRGYTKAPLEEPTVLIKGEEPSPMAALGDPIYPEAPMIEPEERRTAQPAAAGSGAQPKAGAVPAGATQADVDAGSTIFGATGNCFTCHGQNGTGGALAPALNDAKWLNIDGSFASIQQIVNAGVPQPKEHPAPMPAKGGAQLTDQQVKQVAAYVYSISH